MQVILHRVFFVALLLVAGCAADAADTGHPEAAPESETEVAELDEQATPLTDSAVRARRCGGPFGLRCPSDEVCAVSSAPGTCPGPKAYGVCQPRRLCPQIFKPVCGCDGRTYSNACAAASAGVSVRSDGECVPSGPFCGGFAGIACPGEGSCADDPRDDCDPNAGGADCGGVCVCRDPHSCPLGSRFDTRPSVCACVRDTVLCPSAPCTFTDCAAGLRCVERDCKAVCEPIGGGCGPCPPGELCTDVCAPLPTPTE